MDISLNRRYPGSQPFQREHQHIFFGRKDDIERLYTTVNVNQLTVLHGKSGLGKSSLLNAGVIPKFSSQNRYLAIPLRFFPFDGIEHTDPLAEIRRQLLAIPHQEMFLGELSDTRTEPSLWQLHKTLEWGHRERTGLLLVFDQFEELFSYPEGKIEAFGREFADMALNRMPADIQQKLYERMENQADFAENHALELSFIEEPPLMKLILSIRSDRLSFLDRLKPFLPAILKNTYELQPLSREQAEEAIVSPAASTGSFSSPSFVFAPNTLKAMLDYLTSEGTKPVESTQLQVICQYAENKIVKAGQVLSPGDLGNISEIYKNHYNAILHSFEPDERLRVSRLIEDGLIYESEKRRLSLFEGQILETWKIRRESLAALVNIHHLLRVEPLSTGGFSYEISHDSLVDPILHAREVRVASEDRRRKEQEEKELREKEREHEEELRIKRQRAVFMRYSMVVTALAVTAVLMLLLLMQNQKELTSAQKDLRLKQDSVVALLRFTQKSNDSILGLHQQIRIGNYSNFITRGDGLFRQKEFIQAKESYQTARNIFQENESLPDSLLNRTALNDRIRQCEIGQARQVKFKALIDRAQQYMDGQRYTDAYPLYVDAYKMNYDAEAVADKLNLCRSYLEVQVEKYLTQIGSMLEKSKYRDGAKKWAEKAIIENVDPILQMIQDETNTSKKTLALHEKREELFQQSSK